MEPRPSEDHSESTQSESHRSSSTQWFKRVLIVGVLLLAVGGIVAFFATQTAPPSPSVASAGWSGQAIACASRDGSGDQRLWDADVGDVIAINGDIKNYLTMNGCTKVSDDASSTIDVSESSEGARYFLAVTKADRNTVRLVDVDTAAPVVSLTVEHHTPAPDCLVTTEWRGHLLLLIEGPGEVETPSVTMQQHFLTC